MPGGARAVAGLTVAGAVAPPIASLDAVGVVRGGTTLLDGVALQVRQGHPMAVLGPNGAGKTTLLRILSTHLFPTSGSVEVFGERFGSTDLRTLRHRVALSSVAMTPLLPMTHTATALVAAARQGVLRAQAVPDHDERTAAVEVLARVGASAFADRPVRTLSQGEWQRVQIARALAVEPELVLLDEPFAGLDLGGREALVRDLDALLARADAPALVMVAHHLEELPSVIGDAVLLRGGRVVAAGAIDEVVVDEAVSTTFGVDVTVERRDGRLAARVRS